MIWKWHQEEMMCLLKDVFLFCFFVHSAFAEPSDNYFEIKGLDGKLFFNINIANEGNLVWYVDGYNKSDFTLNDAKIGALTQGMEY